MQKRGNSWVYSPSDLIQFVENEAVTWLERFDKERPGLLCRDEGSATDSLIQAAGDEYESAFLMQLMREGRDVANLRDTDNAATATLDAMRLGREIIYQARLEAGEFGGYADFLMRVDGPSRLGSYHYEVWDTKLARRLKPYFAIQLCCYAEMIEVTQGVRPEWVWVVLGNGLRQRLHTDDYFFYYRAVKRAFLEQQQSFDPDKWPKLSGVADYRHWTGYVNGVLENRDDLSLIANIRATQIEKLNQAGINTLTQIAMWAQDPIPTLEPATFQRLRMQAALQLASHGTTTPVFELIPADPERPSRGLGNLPPVSPQDVSFDIEGYPLVDGGMEYLFGAVYSKGTSIQFCDWWAHDRAQERQAFEQFVHWAHDRWTEDPKMHIYHYASYEVTALKRLMSRHGCCEAEVDDLLRNGVFVDLYTVVRQSLVIGEPAYSLKNVEHLYMPSRAGKVATAGDSMVQYHRWLQFRDGDDWQTSQILRAIREYNEDDCRSTWSLLEWLRNLQATSGVSYAAITSGGKKPGEATTNRAALAQEMLEEAQTSKSGDDERWRVHKLLAHLLEFHRREQKPLWWFLFERAGMTDQELIEDPDCLGGLERTSAPPEIVKRSLRYEFRFDPAQESKLRDGDKCCYAHDIDTKIELDKIDYAVGRVWFTLSKTRPAPPAHLSLIPDDIVHAKYIAESIERTVRNYRETGQLPSALDDFLFRAVPRIASHSDTSLIADDKNLLSCAESIVERMQGTTLFIQGPPGCGKTFTGGHLIASLLRSGKRVGVTSNSHRAICLLLKATAEAADALGVKFRGVKAG